MSQRTPLLCKINMCQNFQMNLLMNKRRKKSDEMEDTHALPNGTLILHLNKGDIFFGSQFIAHLFKMSLGIQQPNILLFCFVLLCFLLDVFVVVLGDDDLVLFVCDFVCFCLFSSWFLWTVTA